MKERWEAGARPALSSVLEVMLRDLRDVRADRREPCGVHERPQWTCAYCLCNLLVDVEAALGRPQ